MEGQRSLNHLPQHFATAQVNSLPAALVFGILPNTKTATCYCGGPQPRPPPHRHQGCGNPGAGYQRVALHLQLLPLYAHHVHQQLAPGVRAALPLNRH